MAASLTQAELADWVGVDRSHISGLKRGQRNPTIVRRWHIAEALKVSTRFLMRRIDHDSEVWTIGGWASSGRRY